MTEKRNENTRLLISIGGMLILLLASMGGVYLQAQSYTDRRMEERKQSTDQALNEIKKEQKDQKDILWDINGKLQQLLILQEKDMKNKERRQ